LVVTRYGWAIPVARVLVGVGVAVVASATGVVAGVAGAFVCAFAVCLGLATAIDRLRPVRPTIGQVRAAVPVPRGVPDPDHMAWMGLDLYDPDTDPVTRPVIDLTDERPGYGADIDLKQTRSSYVE
jgi:hypothetical protein